MILVTLCTLLASETMFLTSMGRTCDDIVSGISDGNEGCSIVLAMRPALGWTVGAILFVIFILTVCVIIRLRHRHSGIYADPTTIAGASCLLSNYSGAVSSVLFHDEARVQFLPPLGDPKVYSSFQVSDATGPPSDPICYTQTPPRKRKSQTAMHPASLAAFWLFLVGLLVMMLYYRFVSKPGTGNAFEDFMNSQSFGVRILMTGLGLLTKFYWGWIEGYMRRIRPYIALASSQGATADKSVLLSSPSHPVTALFYSETWNSFLLTMVTLMAVLSEVLIITLSGIPFSPALAYLAFELSVFISVGIVAAMVLSAAIVLAWTMLVEKRRNLPDIPASIADVFALLDDEETRRALRALYGYEAGSHSHVKFMLRRRAGDGKWCIKIWTPGSPSLEC